MVPSLEPSTVLEATRSAGQLAKLKAIGSLFVKSLDSEATSASCSSAAITPIHRSQPRYRIAQC